MINKKNYYVFISLSIAIVLCLAMILSCMFIYTDNVYAEEESLVNFNQLVISPFYNETSVIAFNSVVHITNNLFNTNNHVYYYRMTYNELIRCQISIQDLSSSSYIRISGFNDVGYTSLEDGNYFRDGLFICPYDSAYFYFYKLDNVNVTVYNCNIIDLTQMYGDTASSLTLEQCHSIFTSPTYDYTTGTPVNIGYETGYDYGYESGYDNGYASGNYANNQYNRVINFNQLVPNNSINQSAVSGDQITLLSDFDWIEDHNYYIRYTLSMENDYRSSIFVNSGNTTIFTLFDYTASESQGYHSIIFQVDDSYSNTNINAFFGYDSWSMTGFNIFDLTQMYGNDIPTLEELDIIYDSDYYSFTTSTLIYTNSLDSYENGYTQGFNDAWSSQDLTYRQYLVGSQSFVYSNTTIEEGEKIWDNNYQLYMFTGVLGIPLGGSVSSGTNFDVDFILFIPDLQGEPSDYYQNFILHFGYVDSTNSLVELSAINPIKVDTISLQYTGSFNTLVDTDTIYIWESYNTRGDNYSPTQLFVVQSNMTFRTQNIESAINTAYQSGVDSVINDYKPGGTQYNAIYDLGRVNGINEKNPYTFGALMSSVIEAPLNAVLGIFNFDFMGYNMKNFITFLLTLCVILVIVRLFVSGGN